MTTIFYEFLIYNIVGIFITLICGNILSSFFSSDKPYSIYQSIFQNLLVGFIALVFFTSTYITKGITVNILILLIAFYFIWFNKLTTNKPRYNAVNLKHLITEFLYCILFVTPFLLQEFFYFVDSSAFHFIVPHFDFSSYANLSSSLFEFGKENKDRVLNVMFPSLYDGVTPYHYFELWLNGLFSNIFMVSPLKSLMLITYPLLKLGVLVGILSLMSLKYTVKIQHIILAFMLLSISGLFFSFYDDYELTKYYIGYTQTGVLSFGRKYLPLYIAGLFSVYFILKQQYENAVTFSLFLAIFSVGAAPGIFSIALISSAFLSFKTKKYAQLLFVIAFIFCFFVFYKIFTIEVTTEYINQNGLYKKLLNNFFDITLIKEFIFSFFFPLCRVVIVYFPYLAIVIFLTYLYKRADKKTLILLSVIGFLICVFSSFFAALMNGTVNSGQLLYNNLPLFNTIIISLIVILYQVKSNRILIFSFVALLSIYNYVHFHTFIETTSLSIYNEQSDTFKIDCVKALENNNTKAIIGYSLNDSGYSEGGLISYYKYPGLFLGLNTKGNHFIDINPFRIHEYEANIPESDRYWVNNLEINIYKQRQNLVLTVKDIQYSFIKKNNIKYLYIQKNSVLSNSLYDELKIKKTIEDNKTGDRFLILF